MSALECLHRENDKLRSVIHHLVSWSDLQTASIIALKVSFFPYICRSDIAESENSTYLIVHVWNYNDN